VAERLRPGGKGDARRDAYLASGVDVAAGERAVDLMRAAVTATHGPHVLSALGGFAAAVAIPPGYREPVLVSSTDGVGTKTAIAAALRRYDTIGIDLVAMCVDDIVCAGARPLFLLDYLAVGRLEPDGVAELVGSVAAGCLEAGCALVGGETAEHPGLMEPGAFDLAGCAVGVVERDRMLDGSAVRAGDAIVGLAASGLHANGYSLVRGMIGRWNLDLAAPYRAQLRRSLGDSEGEAAIAREPQHAMATLGDVLLTPTRIYAPGILALGDALEAVGSGLHAAAHITGGGLPGNVPRVLPPGLGARVDPSRWWLPSVQRLMGALGGLADEELRATFNGGLGMVAIVPQDAVPAAISCLADRGYEASLVGEIVDAAELDGRTYAEGPLQGATG
jgi:phosphoribosylformylglycinamidine cyclo-ligase